MQILRAIGELIWFDELIIKDTILWILIIGKRENIDLFLLRESTKLIWLFYIYRFINRLQKRRMLSIRRNIFFCYVC